MRDDGPGVGRPRHARVDPALFPNVVARAAEAGLDPTRELVPVAPAAHYVMGGVVTDLDGATTVPGLYAVGESACTGLHGANRLASNSLSECFVFGRRARARGRPEPSRAPAAPSRRPRPPRPSRRGRRARRCGATRGLVRTREGLERLLDDPHPLVGLIAARALLRTRRRGAHFRADFPRHRPRARPPALREPSPAPHRLRAMDVTRIDPGLEGVPETLLWTLYHRALEARRPDAVLRDPVAVELVGRIDYPFAARFGTGRPAQWQALRVLAFDREVRRFLRRHPEGTVVALGEGLETQCRRVDNGRVRWIGVDLPETVAVRRRLLPDGPRHRTIAASVLDEAWMDEVDATRGVLLTAQGLLMYLDPPGVHGLIARCAARFPGTGLLFDAVPRGWQRPPSAPRRARPATARRPGPGPSTAPNGAGSRPCRGVADLGRPAAAGPRRLARLPASARDAPARSYAPHCCPFGPPVSDRLTGTQQKARFPPHRGPPFSASRGVGSRTLEENERLMYQVSRAIYRELRLTSPGVESAHEAVLRTCEATIERMVGDQHYFAAPARTLFNDLRPHFDIAPGRACGTSSQRYVGAAEELLERLPRTGSTPTATRCSAARRRAAGPRASASRCPTTATARRTSTWPRPRRSRSRRRARRVAAPSRRRAGAAIGCRACCSGSTSAGRSPTPCSSPAAAASRRRRRRRPKTSREGVMDAVEAALEAAGRAGRRRRASSPTG